MRTRVVGNRGCKRVAGTDWPREVVLQHIRSARWLVGEVCNGVVTMYAHVPTRGSGLILARALCQETYDGSTPGRAPLTALCVDNGERRWCIVDALGAVIHRGELA